MIGIPAISGKTNHRQMLRAALPSGNILKTEGAFDPTPLLRTLNGSSVTDTSVGVNVFCEGDPADSVYYITDGRVKLSVVSLQGKEAVLGLLDKGNFFGEACLSGRRTRIYKAETLSPCTIVRVPLDEMRCLIAANPSFCSHFLAFVIQRNARMGEDLIDHIFNRSEKRLARALLLLADLDSTRLNNPRIGRISQETLAEMVGTTRSRVSYFMNKFRRLGFIRYQGEIEVDISLLKVVLND